MTWPLLDFIMASSTLLEAMVRAVPCLSVQGIADWYRSAAAEGAIYKIGGAGAGSGTSFGGLGFGKARQWICGVSSRAGRVTSGSEKAQSTFA
jgi:hypothetical protein